METVYGCAESDATHRFIVTLVNGRDKKCVDLHLDSGNFAAMCKAIRKVYLPSWTIDEFSLTWEDSI